MDPIAVILTTLTVLLCVVITIAVIATFIVLMGPPDAHDVDIQGEIKKKDK
jgi:hypothetical protein